jgi:ubiquinone/menaquinone biosynthesis C-methylase UbiE
MKTSWKSVGKWYDSIVGEEGHFYHKTIILPKTIELLKLNEKSRVLDLACGQGVLARHLPKGVKYVGVDIASTLIAAAKRYSPSPHHTFLQADLTKPWPLDPSKKFSHAVCILALQNIEKPEIIFEELSKVLEKGGKAIFVINHPYYRIPRKSCWGFNESTKTQTREITAYMTPQKIPIVTHPGKEESTTWSFHFPLSHYVAIARKNGFVIEQLEEWCSPKVSTGKASTWENRARQEFPLFMALALKLYQ